MEATKKVGAPDPSGPQGLSSAGSQQLGSCLKGSQESWISSGSLFLSQGLTLSAEATIEELCGLASQLHTHESIHQLLKNPSPVNSQWCCEKASQNISRCSSNNPLQRPPMGDQPHLIMEDGILTLPVCTHSDSSNIGDMIQNGPSCPQLLEQVARESKTSSKVLVGWGKGPSIIDQMAPLDNRKSLWWPPSIPSEEDEAAIALSSLPASAQDPAQASAPGQSPGKCPCPVQATVSSTSLPLSAPAQANNPTQDMASVPIVIKPYTCTLDCLTDTIAITKNLSQDLLLRKCGNQRSTSLESSKMDTFCQEKVGIQLQGEPLTPAPTPTGTPDDIQEHKVTRRQMLPEQSENLEENLLAGSCKATSGPEHSGTPKSQSTSCEGSSSQPDQQPLNGCNTYTNVPLSAYQAAYHRWPPIQSSVEVLQIPLSSAPTCQLREAMEDNVQVFDMATGNTRIELLCHDLMDSQAVLVGVLPNHPSIHIPENTQSLATPVDLADRPCSNFCSTPPVLSSPVPSSLSSGSYPEVALLPKEARLNLESQNSPDTETPIRVRMLTRPISQGMPLQFGEKILIPVPNNGWLKPDAEKNEPSYTIWMVDTAKMPDEPMVQTKKLQWMDSEKILEPAPSANPQEVPRILLQEHTKHHNQNEVLTMHPDNPLTEAMKIPFTGQLPPTEQVPLVRKIPAEGWPSQAGQPTSAEQSPITGQAHYTGQTQSPCTKQPPLPEQHFFPEQLLLTKQVTLTGQLPFCREPISTKEPTPSKGSQITRDPGQPSTLCQEAEPLGLPTQVGVLQVPLAPEETCMYLSREKVSCGATQSSSVHQLEWQPGNSPRVQEKQLSLITFTTPDSGCKVLPIAMVGTEPQGTQLKITAENITHSSVVAHIDLPHGTCDELMSTMDALPVQFPVICRHFLGPYQDMAAIVIDTGTGFTKCGLAAKDRVLSVVPSRVQLLQPSAQGQPQYIVPEDQEGTYPVLNRGVISDWDALEVLWQHLFCCRLGVQPEELAVLVADSPISPRTNREKVAEILFEHFHVPAMQAVHQALLALYAYGRTTGLVLGSGYGTSYAAPILTGDFSPLDTYRLDIGGCDLTEYLVQLLLAGGHSPPKTELVNHIKETSCYVTMDMVAEMACTQAQACVDFVLPDKQVITLGSERFHCPEALFQPNLLGLNQPGLPQLALESIRRLESKQQEQLLANVVLDGGSTLMNGFPERLRKELGPGATVLGSPHRAVAVWLGGSIMASRDAFQSLWLSRREYEEEGPWAIYKYHL